MTHPSAIHAKFWLIPHQGLFSFHSDWGSSFSRFSASSRKACAIMTRWDLSAESTTRSASAMHSAAYRRYSSAIDKRVPAKKLNSKSRVQIKKFPKSLSQDCSRTVFHNKTLPKLRRQHVGVRKIQAVRGGLYSHCREIGLRGQGKTIENRRCVDTAGAGSRKAAKEIGRPSQRVIYLNITVSRVSISIHQFQCRCFH